MRQMVFAYVLIKGWTVDPDEHWFLYQPREILLFPAHYTEVVQSDVMTWVVVMVIYRGGGF